MKKPDACFSHIRKDIMFLASYLALFLSVMAALRGLLLYRNIELAQSIPDIDIVNAFIVGMRFDLVIGASIAIPLVFALLLTKGLNSRRLAIIWLSVTGLIIIFAGIVDLDFYHEFHTHLNSLTFQYIKEDPNTVLNMIWHGFPVIKYLLLTFFIWAVYLVGLNYLNVVTKPKPNETSSFFIRLIAFTLVLFLFAWGARGTLRSGPPLRWGDAFQSKYLFVNHLGLNATYTLVKAAINASKDNPSQHWLALMSEEKALKLTRQLLLTKNDALLVSGAKPILRKHTPLNKLTTPPKNVVVIIMESFSAEFVGALGHHYGITPEFDKLVEEGVLFDHFFSNGTHTHQGMFATGVCFPNLPGREYLMQQAEGQHAFSGLPVILGPRGFNNLYVYNGDFSWDNQEGFFRTQGMTKFIGRKDYKNPKFSNPTWGVSDEDMFNKAVKEISNLPAKKPFYAILQSLSNHTPYALPKKLSIEPVTGFGELNLHLTAQRYSDWALGAFFEQAKKTDWYDETAFVIIGDHGFGINRQLSEFDLLRFHVPMLIIAPGIQDAYGARRHIVGTQVDIVPTIVSLLGHPFKHQCWGRDLLSLANGDPGSGVIKPSGGDQTAAFIRGNYLLIKQPHSKTILGKYSFYPKETYQHEDNKVLKKQLKSSLDAYVQTALIALKNNQTGVKVELSN